MSMDIDMTFAESDLPEWGRWREQVYHLLPQLKNMPLNLFKIEKGITAEEGLPLNQKMTDDLFKVASPLSQRLGVILLLFDNNPDRNYGILASDTIEACLGEEVSEESKKILRPLHERFLSINFSSTMGRPHVGELWLMYALMYGLARCVNGVVWSSCYNDSELINGWYSSGEFIQLCHKYFTQERQMKLMGYWVK